MISISISKAYSWTTGMADRQMDQIEPIFFLNIFPFVEILRIYMYVLI